MKYYILLLSLIILLLTGCSQKKTLENHTQAKEKTQIQAKSIFTGGLFSDTLNIDGLQGPITISGKLLLFENIFSIAIPKNLKNRRYETTIPNSYINQNLSFSEKDNIHSFYITVGDTKLLQKSINNQDVCLSQTTYNGSPTFKKNTIQKTIGTNNIFTTEITFFIEGNIPPYDYIYITHLCFIKDAIMYDIVLDNYTFSEAKPIIKSFAFLD